MVKAWSSARRGGSATIMTIGALIIGLGTSVFAIDLPYYFTVRNQLQTAVDAGALAGATALPYGEIEAQNAALELASENSVANLSLQPDHLTYQATRSQFTVTGKVQVPTVMGKLLCALSRQTQNRRLISSKEKQIRLQDDSERHCNRMTVVASASAAPAARDIMLVIDSSSSMDDLGNNRPLRDVESAASRFIDTIVRLDNEAGDRIGLVTFDRKGTLAVGLTSQSESPDYMAVRNHIEAIRLFEGTGWNTNYEAGLHQALDELELHGRTNAQKLIIFLTDGMPNLPAPNPYYAYNRNEPYRKCTDSVNHSAPVKNLCATNSQGQRVCPTLPNPVIKTRMIASGDYQCATDYVQAMESLTNAQADRAKRLKAIIHTIVMHDNRSPDHPIEILRRMSKDEKWLPQQIDYMAQTTQGHQYEARNDDALTIRNVYQQIAQDIRIRLIR